MAREKSKRHCGACGAYHEQGTFCYCPSCGHRHWLHDPCPESYVKARERETDEFIGKAPLPIERLKMGFRMMRGLSPYGGSKWDFDE